MLNDCVRTCGVCEDTIGKGAVFQRMTCRPEAAALLAGTPDLAAAFTRNADGSVALDIRLDCVGQMGQLADKQGVH